MNRILRIILGLTILLAAFFWSIIGPALWLGNILTLAIYLIFLVILGFLWFKDPILKPIYISILVAIILIQISMFIASTIGIMEIIEGPYQGPAQDLYGALSGIFLVLYNLGILILSISVGLIFSYKKTKNKIIFVLMIISLIISALYLIGFLFVIVPIFLLN